MTATDAAQAYIDELSEWLRIPSVSADSAHRDDVTRAAEWTRDLVRRGGGDCEVVDWNGRPLVVGEFRATMGADSAPTMLVYGHFDVQPPAPLELWESPPFEPEVRGGYLYARGAADDKGQLYVLLKAAALLASEGSLPVNVRVACDGEEEVGGHSIVDFLAEDERGADVAVIYDATMLARGRPAFHVATRGLVYFQVRVRTGERDLHSGLYGGAALNAMHALIEALSAVVPRDGRVPEPLRVGISPPTRGEVDDWSRLRHGGEELADQGGRPSDADAADEFYHRTWAEPAVDIHGIIGGEAQLQKTVLPASAQANVSIRLAPGQRVDEVAPVFEQLVREAAPDDAEVEIERLAASESGVVPPDARAIELALDVFERTFGNRPALIRSGGTLPIVPALVNRDIPTLLTGVALPDANIHSPNERLVAEYIPLGVELSKDLIRAFSELR